MNVEWRPDEHGQLRPYLPSQPEVRVSWAPQPGSQTKFLQNRTTEVLLAGNRGGGKTDALLMDFAQFVGRGFGPDWRGILFRRTFEELKDVIAKSLRWYSEIFPRATYNQGNHTWTFEGGEVLIMSFIKTEEDYYRYHGHAYPWIGWEELTNWPSDRCYKMMLSTLRSTNPSVPRRVRSTCNPYGVGHNWVKARFGLPLPPSRTVGEVIKTEGEPDRVAIRSDLNENRVLEHAEPNYRDTLRAAARNKSELDAWIGGSWDIVAGGMFDDIWQLAYHVIPPLPLSVVPGGWRLDRAFDWGLSKPFSVGFYAQSNGEPITWEGVRLGEVRGDLLRLGEWYGWNGHPNEGLMMAARDIAKGIVERETEWGVRERVRPGPADSAIFNADPRDPGQSIASEMEKHGVAWEAASKGQGSRTQGWEAMRAILKGAVPAEKGARENPGLFISSACKQFIRTVPVLPRDQIKLDDVDTESEDHVADEVRYRVRRPRVVEEPTPYLNY